MKTLNKKLYQITVLIVSVLIAILVMNTCEFKAEIKEAPKPKIKKKTNSTLALSDSIYSAPESIKIHSYILKYSKKYDVPVELSYNVIRMETGFRGPLHFKYNPHQISSGYAYGPMQILLSTARWFMNDSTITKQDLLYNTDLNVEIGIKYLSYLYDRKENWTLALGYYNTGYWKINNYARTGSEGIDNI